jgi:hypothetical protein
MTQKATLKGVLSYPHLNNPDTKFNTDGEFKTAVVCSLSVAGHSELVEKLEAQLDKFIVETNKKAKKKVKAHPDGLPFDVDEDEGTVTFRTKSKAYKSKETGELFTIPMAFFAKDKTPLGVVKVDEGELVASDTVPQIGGGTKAVVSCEIKPWVASGKAGISLRPRAFKLIEVQEPSGADADSFGLDDDDDFEAPVLNTSGDEPDNEDFDSSDF